MRLSAGLLPLLAPETLDLSQNKTQPEHNSSSQNQPTGGAAASAAAAFKTEADTSLQSCYQTIVESLRSHDPALISGLQGFVQELRRITVLWEELWLGSLVQTHHDVMRRQQQLADEIRRVNSNPTLAGPHKAALIREKHWAIMKPVSQGTRSQTRTRRAHAHACTHAHTHTLTHTHTHIHAHARTHTRIHTRARTHTRTHTYTRTHTHTHAHTHVRT